MRSPRSGFSFLSTAEGILLHGAFTFHRVSVLLLISRIVGGYCKEYVKGSRPVGVMLEDTWFLK